MTPRSYLLVERWLVSLAVTDLPAWMLQAGLCVCPCRSIEAGCGSLPAGSLPGRRLGGGEKQDGRAVQVGASHPIPAFDVAQRDVASMAQESSDALSAGSVLPLATRVIMVHMDELPVLKRPVAHSARLLLCSQQAIELLLSQPVASDPVLPVRLLAGLR
jgi:hypothetical protein